ncbi:MAG: hypothetical protein HFG30_09415 [Eubacterium sp.]|nr:hypothetical protein [Eubacterium sp.]
MIKKYFCKNILFLFTLYIVSLLMMFTVFSGENLSSINLVCKYNGKTIENMEIHLYKAADVINGEIIVKPCFDKIAADLKQLTDMDDTKGVAEKIQLLLAVSDLKPDKITVTDQFGKGIFSQLKEGIYYIESVKYIEEEKEYMIMPLVLSVPQKQSGANNVYDIDAIPKIVERNVEQTSKTTNVITEETTTVENTTEDFTTKEQISKATDDNPKLPQTGLKTMNVVLIGCFGIALTLLGVRILKNEE